jgi:arginase
MTYGQPFHGTDSGPRLLRQAGLRTMLTTLGWRVEDVGDMVVDSTQSSKPKFLSNAKNSCIVGPATAHLADLVQSKVREGYFPLILGGDHSIGIGSLSGILRARPDVGVLWIDAHADLNTPETSGSGNLHGMPLGLLMSGMEIDYSKYPGLEWLTDGPRLKPDSIVYVGLRDVDLPEAEAIHNLGIRAYTMHDIDRYGIGTVMDRALNHLLKNNPDRPLHLSYDIDAIDPIHAPATGTAVRGGLTFREAHFVAELVAQNGNLASAELVELNHTLSDGEGAKETVDLGLQIVTSLMGKSII